MDKENRATWGALFDLDGVLIDTEGIYTIFWHDIDVKFPTGVANFEYVIKGSTLETILTSYFKEEDRPEILFLLKEHEKDMVYRYFDGIEAFLNRLRELRVPSAIVTSSNAAKMKVLFEKLPSLRQLVDIVVTGDDVQRSKPDPEGYRIAAQRLGLPSQRCVVFEDSIAGVRAGRCAGGAVVAFTTTNAAEKLREFADVIVDSIQELDAEKLPQLLPD